MPIFSYDYIVVEQTLQTSEIVKQNTQNLPFAVKKN